MDENTLVNGLLYPEAHPWHPQAVELVETHISWVFLAGERIIKVKNRSTTASSITLPSSPGFSPVRMKSGSTAA
jgi:hypothetical protein